MSKQLFVKVTLHEGRYGYEPATQQQIDAAAGVAELTKQLEMSKRTVAEMMVEGNDLLRQLTAVTEQRDALLAAAESFVNAALRKWDGGIECLNCDTNTVPPEPQKHKEWCEIKTFEAAIDICDKAAMKEPHG